MAEKYTEMDHKEYAKLVMAPGDQNLLQKIVNFAKGTIFSVVLVLTGITGFTYAFFVSLVLLLISPKLLFIFFRFVQVTWNQCVVLGLRCLHNCSYRHFGDSFRPEDKKILVLANHRTRMDWLIILNFLYNQDKIGGLRFSLKAPLRLVPGVGWFLSLACHVFLKRRFEDDREHILDCLELYSKTMDDVCFYFFPEGTVYWPDMIRKSNSFAAKAGAEPLKHLLLPRTTGFKFLMDNEDHFFDAIYDITTSYEEHVPQHEPALFTGCMPPITNVVLKSDQYVVLVDFAKNDQDKIGGLRFSLKAPLRLVPGVGWFLSLACHVFLKRRFEDDREHILDCLELYSKTMDDVCFYFFPEGTVYWPDMIRKSNSFAAKAGAEPLKHLLLPRTTGFKFLMDNEDHFFDAIYDITTSYEEHVPQHEPALFTGCMPPITNVVLKRYDVASAKTNPEKFLESMWREKDEMLDAHFAYASFYKEQLGTQPYSTSKLENGAKLFGVVFWCWRTYVHLTNFWSFLPFFIFAVACVIFAQKKFFSLSYCLTYVLKAQGFLHWKKIQ